MASSPNSRSARRHKPARRHRTPKRHRRSRKHSQDGPGDKAAACKHSKKSCPKGGASHPNASGNSSTGGGSKGDSTSNGTSTPSQSKSSGPSQSEQGQPAPPHSPSSEAPADEPPSPEPPAGEPQPKSPSGESEPLRLFSATSVFNQELPAAPPLASNSAQLVSSFVSQINKYSGHVVVNTTEWSAPVYVVGANAPTVALVGESSICSRPEGVFSGFQEQIEAVPMPANALPAAGTDKEMIVWQPSTGHLWELWRVLRESGHWTACWGDEITSAYTSDGILPNPYGAGASGLSLLGGQIHLEDLEHGAINHALEVLIPDTSSEFVWPADRTDGASKDASAIPEGTRLRLNPSLNLNSLHMSPAALTIATAIQRYGMIVGDTGGSVALQAQDPTPLIEEGKSNPYNTLLPNPYEALNAIPWSQLEVVSPSYRG